MEDHFTWYAVNCNSLVYYYVRIYINERKYYGTVSVIHNRYIHNAITVDKSFISQTYLKQIPYGTHIACTMNLSSLLVIILVCLMIGPLFLLSLVCFVCR